jgi:hypothetical protein
MTRLPTLFALLLLALPVTAQDQRPLPEGELRALNEVLRRLDAPTAKARLEARGQLGDLAWRHGTKIVPSLTQALKVAGEAGKKAVRRKLAHLEYPGLRDYWDVLAVFDETEMPTIQDAQIVLFNTGGYWITGGGESFDFVYAFGWLLSESESEVRILENTLAASHYDRDCDLPDEWEKFKVQRPKDMPLPGAYKVIDWEEFCDEVIEAGIRDYFGAFGHLVRGGLEHPVEAALYGYWAFLRKDGERAQKLLRLAEESADEYAQRRSGKGQTLAQLVRDSVSTIVRWRAIEAACGGVARAELLDRWRLLLRLSGHDESSESFQMVRHYEALVEEDEAWQEPAPEDIEELSDAEKAAYWMYHLRDVAERQWSQPGSVSILGFWSMAEKERKTAAWRLVDLGWEAVPLLIEHLGDPRPTRSVGFWRNFSKGSYYLLTLGRASREILQKITGRSLPRDDTEAAKKLARAWLKDRPRSIAWTCTTSARPVTAPSRSRASICPRSRAVQRHPDSLALFAEGATHVSRTRTRSDRGPQAPSEASAPMNRRSSGARSSQSPARIAWTPSSVASRGTFSPGRPVKSSATSNGCVRNASRRRARCTTSSSGSAVSSTRRSAAPIARTARYSMRTGS